MTTNNTTLRMALLAGVAVLAMAMPAEAKEHKKAVAKPVVEKTAPAKVKAEPVKVESGFRPFQAGDVMVRVRGLAVLPEVSSSVSIGGKVEASQSIVPEADISYYFTKNIAVEAIAAITRHNVSANGTSSGDVGLGKVTLLPPTVTAQYHFMPDSKFNPYLGAGINYTYFFDHKTTKGSAATKIRYDNTFNPAIQAGFDYNVAGNWFMNVDVKHIFLKTVAKINGGSIMADVNLDPTIVGVGLGYRF